VIPES